MNGQAILADVLQRAGVTEEDFFGRRRSPKLTAARAEAIQELTKLGISASAIGRIVRRNHVTVLYWQRPEMRAHRSAYYQRYHDSIAPEREARRAAKAASRLRAEATKRKPRKLKFSNLISEEAAPIVRASSSVSLPHGLAEEARRRALMPRSLTAAAFGDPPPGYSALDRRGALT